MKYMFGAAGAGITIGPDEAPVFFSLITIGPGAACGAIKGSGTGYGRGMETTMDGGGPDCTTIGGGFDDLLGRSMSIGPGAGPGIMSGGGGGGKGGS